MVEHDYGVLIFIDLSQRVDAVKDENLKLKSENQVRLFLIFVHSENCDKSNH